MSWKIRVAALGLAVIFFACVLGMAAALAEVPGALYEGAPSSVEIRDRDAKLLRELRTRDGAITSTVRLTELSPWVVPALLAAEDARFFSHPGVDPIAIVRAGAQMIHEGRIMSGASTITQQLARALVPRPRTFRGKLREMAIALRIEGSLTKQRILEEYLSRIAFGPNLVGIDAASRWYFDKPASQLDLSEAATLVAIPRGPTLYDPDRDVRAVLRRRDRVLSRMRGRALAPPGAIDLALATGLTLSRRHVEGGVLHFAVALSSGKLPTGLPEGARIRRFDTTINAELQREVEALTRRAASDLSRAGGSALSALVVENASGDVLAYVGSPDYRSQRALGANDGVLAPRQPGSALKPFVYAAAMSGLGMTGATLLPDVPLTLDGADGPYTPKNYDGRSHGPVRLRIALGSSLNVPAIAVTEQLGPAEALGFLRRLGFSSLDDSAEHYGAALALGDGEVRLTELAVAYSTLARGGIRIPLTFVHRAFGTDGSVLRPSRFPGERVMDARIANVITDILADPNARAASFGRGSALEFPFPVASKTGTSKGYRDNWAVGFTHEVTVAVWAGNFDGSPMVGSSGVTGAGPLFHDTLLAAMRGRTSAPLVDTSGLVDVEVCALSGERSGPACPHRVHELFRPADIPSSECTFHENVRIDPENGLLSGPACADSVLRVFERYPVRYLAWAAAAKRPMAPEHSSPRCPVDPTPILHASDLSARLEFPENGARFVTDRDEPSEIVLVARPAAGARTVEFVLDGRSIGTVGAPFALPIRLVPGRHRVELAPAGAGTPATTFEVADAR